MLCESRFEPARNLILKFASGSGSVYVTSPDSGVIMIVSLLFDDARAKLVDPVITFSGTSLPPPPPPEVKSVSARAEDLQ